MPDITLMRRYPEPEGKTTGIGVYSDAIESAFQADRVEYEDVLFKMTTEEGYLRCITEGFIRPFFDVANSKCQLCHATDELCCLYFPFIRGRKIVTFHHVSRDREGRSLFLYPVWKLAARLAVRYSDIIVVPSEETKKELVSVFRAKENKIRVIMHGPDPMFRDEGRPREKLIGFVGTLIERKNVAAGLRAFKIFTKMPGTEGYRFIICGDGPLKKDLLALSEDLGISERVFFISDLSRRELFDLYNNMAVYANPSMHEGLGLTALEAQACGVPVVFFREADIPAEATTHFVPSSDESHFAANMHRLIFDNEYRESVTGSAKDVPDRGYMDKLYEIYGSIKK